MDLLFLDTETTDLDEHAQLVQLAYKDSKSGETMNAYFKPSVPISFGAMAVHHVTEKMVADKPAFEGSEAQQKLQTFLVDHLVVAHNALFDIRVLKTEGLTIDRFIDTLRVAKHLIPSEQYKLQYLRYSLDLDAEGMPHDAMGDVMVLESLFKYLCGVIEEKFSLTEEDAIIHKMIELTHLPVRLATFGFGKYVNKKFEDVSAMDRGYLEWLFASETKKIISEQNEDLVYTLKHFLQ